jgi:hypothetical protein
MRLIEKLKQYEPSLTVEELIEKVENEYKEAIAEEEHDFHRIAEEFKGTYLRRIDKEALFGETLEVYYIKNITNKARTTDWKLTYYVEGDKIAFAARDLYTRKLSGKDVSDTFSEEELKGMEVISEKEYYQYVNEYDNISYLLKSLVKRNYDIR